MKRITSIALVLSMMILFAGCAAHVHTIGNGPQKNELTEQRQWYVLFGLVPLNVVDTKQMAGEAKDYEIRTETSAMDVLMNIFTSYVTINSRTVTVTK